MILSYNVFILPIILCYETVSEDLLYTKPLLCVVS